MKKLSEIKKVTASSELYTCVNNAPQAVDPVDGDEHGEQLVQEEGSCDEHLARLVKEEPLMFRHRRKALKSGAFCTAREMLNINVKQEKTGSSKCDGDQSRATKETLPALKKGQTRLDTLWKGCPSKALGTSLNGVREIKNEAKVKIEDGKNGNGKFSCAAAGSAEFVLAANFHLNIDSLLIGDTKSDISNDCLVSSCESVDNIKKNGAHSPKLEDTHGDDTKCKTFHGILKNSKKGKKRVSLDVSLFKRSCLDAWTSVMIKSPVEKDVNLSTEGSFVGNDVTSVKLESGTTVGDSSEATEETHDGDTAIASSGAESTDPDATLTIWAGARPKKTVRISDVPEIRCFVGEKRSRADRCVNISVY